LKCLKEPLARLANRRDETRGAFFEGRFKSVAILDEEALLATCAYIDLNPVAAGIVDVPEASPHTSITERVEHVKTQGPCGGGPRWGGEKLGLHRFRVHSAFIEEPRDSESARTLLEPRIQAAREPKIPPEGGTPTRSRATELACAQGVRKSIQC
jgi:hypothetical protein